MKQLDRLLLEQGNLCFFCANPVSREDASVEHLWAVATGGTNDEQNVVACCKSINSFFASRPLKEKIAILLRQHGRIKCPMAIEHASNSTLAIAPAHKVDIPEPMFTLAEVPKPSKVALVTLPYTPSPPTTKAPIKASGGPTVKCPTCRASVPKAVGQIDYVCQQCKGAFRY